MKFRTTLTVILLSAVTSLGTIWGYNKITHSNTYSYPQSQNDSGKPPANYAGFNGVAGANPPADFIPASSAAIPATVHIKTKAVRTVSNNLPKRSPHGKNCNWSRTNYFRHFSSFHKIALVINSLSNT